jgi:hypothetical protein
MRSGMMEDLISACATVTLVQSKKKVVSANAITFVAIRLSNIGFYLHTLDSENFSVYRPTM